jgi:hypothetical protein
LQPVPLLCIPIKQLSGGESRFLQLFLLSFVGVFGKHGEEMLADELATKLGNCINVS